MLTRLQPTLGAWYEDLDRGVLFEIVDIDEQAGFIAAQYFDGELEELDLDSFMRMRLREAVQPEDWTGPFEVDEDLDERVMDTQDHWNASLDQYDSDSMQIIDD